MAAEQAVKEIKDMAQPVENSETITRVAAISAGNDEEVGSLIAEAMDKVGRDGVITMAESQNGQTGLRVVKGMQFDRGLISPYFVTDMATGVAEYTNARVLCVDKELSSLREMQPLLEDAIRCQEPLVIIAHDFPQSDLLPVLITNKIRAGFKVLPVKAPDFGEFRTARLEDIAELTGGTMFTEALGRKLETSTMNDLGVCDKITVTRESTTIVAENPEAKARVADYVTTLRARLERTSNTYEADKIRELTEQVAELAEANRLFKEKEIKQQLLDVYVKDLKEKGITDNEVIREAVKKAQTKTYYPKDGLTDGDSQ